MKSKAIQQLLRILVALLGAGLGTVIAFLITQIHMLTTGGAKLSLVTLLLLYLGLGGILMLVFYLLSPRFIRWCTDAATSLEHRLDNLTLPQLSAACAGLITGLIIAALLSQFLMLMGSSFFTLACSAILFVLLGVTGLSVGVRRTADFAALLGHLPTRRGKKTVKHSTVRRAVRPKLLDVSALADGRVGEVARTGFLEGELLVPACVVEELNRLASSADENRRMKGRRGLDTLEHMRQNPALALSLEKPAQEASADLTTALLRQAKKQGAALITADLSLSRAAAQAGLTVLNLNDLTCALRPQVAAGDRLTVKLTREGREPGQAVGYLSDGTMLVVEGAQNRVGQTVDVVVSSVLQTSAGKMVFSKLQN